MTLLRIGREGDLYFLLYLKYSYTNSNEIILLSIRQVPGACYVSIRRGRTGLIEDIADLLTAYKVLR